MITGCEQGQKRVGHQFPGASLRLAGQHAGFRTAGQRRGWRKPVFARACRGWKRSRPGMAEQMHAQMGVSVECQAAAFDRTGKRLVCRVGFPVFLTDGPSCKPFVAALERAGPGPFPGVLTLV